MQKIETRPLMCRLTEDELEQESKTLTILLTQKAHLEIQKSNSNKRFTDLIKAKDVEIEKQIPIVRDRKIEREVEVRIDYNTPEQGKKTVTRLDTMEIIFEGQMTDSECSDLFINQQQPAEDENAQGQKLLAAPRLPPPFPETVDAEEVIKIDGSTDDLVLEEGKIYEFQGIIYRAIKSHYPNKCDGCHLDGPKCTKFYANCDKNDLILEQIPGGITSDQSDLSDKSDPSDESPESAASEGTCSKCGITGKCIFHVDRESPLCGVCLDKKNKKNIDKLERELASKHRVLMRPAFGYGCRSEYADTTCFRFMFCDEERSDGKCSSWGNPIYLRGNYQTSGSQAEIYFRSLLEAGVEED